MTEPFVSLRGAQRRGNLNRIPPRSSKCHSTGKEMFTLQYYVYMMTNINKNVLYTGVSNNLVRRVYEHKNHLDKGSFTDRYNATLLVYYESTTDVRATIEREKQIKSWKRARKNELVNALNPQWKDLYPEILP